MTMFNVMTKLLELFYAKIFEFIIRSYTLLLFTCFQKFSFWTRLCDIKYSYLIRLKTLYEFKEFVKIILSKFSNRSI